MGYYVRLTSFIIILLFGLNPLWSQSVEGFVYDAETGEPVPYASVYFANTLTGTSTRNDGGFSLEAFSPGKYVLTVSFVGYKTFLSEVLLEQDEHRQVRITLTPEAVSLPEIYVRADTSDRDKHMNIFEQQFLGANPAAGECRIVNSQTLAFYFDPKDRTFYAHAREPLQVRNEYLGYLLTYDMSSFTYNVDARRINYLGVSRYEELQDDRKHKQWQRNRQRVYEGSPRHFFRTLYEDGLADSKFKVYLLDRLPNPERRSEPVIREKITYFDSLLRVGEESGNNQFRDLYKDSLDHYVHMWYYMPKYVDETKERVKQAGQLMKGNVITYTGWLKIRFREQVSLIQITEPVRLYANGYYEEILSVFLEGYWGREYTISTLLPLDYTGD